MLECTGGHRPTTLSADHVQGGSGASPFPRKANLTAGTVAWPCWHGFSTLCTRGYASSSRGKRGGGGQERWGRAMADLAAVGIVNHGSPLGIEGGTAIDHESFPTEVREEMLDLLIGSGSTCDGWLADHELQAGVGLDGSEEDFPDGKVPEWVLVALNVGRMNPFGRRLFEVDAEDSELLLVMGRTALKARSCFEALQRML